MARPPFRSGTSKPDNSRSKPMLMASSRTIDAAEPKFKRRKLVASNQWSLTGNHADPASAIEERSRCLLLADLAVTKSSSPLQTGHSGPFRSEAPGPSFRPLSALISWISSGCLSKRQPPCPALSAIRSKCSRHSLKNLNISSSGKLSAAAHTVAKLVGVTRAAPVKDVSCSKPTAVAPVCPRATRPDPLPGVDQSIPAGSEPAPRPSPEA